MIQQIIINARNVRKLQAVLFTTTGKKKKSPNSAFNL